MEENNQTARRPADPRAGLVDFHNGRMVFIGTRVPVATLWYYLAREEANDGGVKSFVRDFDVPLEQLARVIHAAGELFSRDQSEAEVRGLTDENHVRRERPMGAEEDAP